MKILELEGKRFGNLTVIRRNGYLSNGGTAKLKAWECLCDCGNTITVRGSCLVSGHTVGCGCVRTKKMVERSTTHGKRNHPLYNIWAGMRSRCGLTKSGSKNSRFYKDCGITVCDKWDTFEAFYQWAESRWRKGLQIDRIDTLGNYSPENCRFITQKKNTQNTKRGKIWFIYGKRFESSGDAAKFFGFAQSHIYFMCHGRKTKTKHYKPEQFCYTVKRYDNGNNKNL